MNSTQLNLETVTPMFLHGYDNRVVELRPPPFKALFRYWWRAVQDCNVDSLRETEAKLFGSTDGKAPFSIRIPGKKDLGVPLKYSPLPHKNTFKMDAYDVGKQFNLCLITKNASDASTYRQIAKLGFLLGGVGNRSRRGFGSIRETCWSFADVPDLRQEVLDTLNNVAKFEDGKRFEINKGGAIELTHPSNTLPQYPVVGLIGFGNPTTDVGCLLKDIGQATHTHRDDALGYAKGQRRLASPIHVRVQKVGKKYVPVVTLLRWNYPGYESRHIHKQISFVAEIIT
ncbi:MAG: type III-B CRISPR module RAMP protein Cmr1 [Candidatus Poribacteria bacterium]|nr:type III-B CRISPR module RAMP protein Cmr1 [Candidatus Poribacteria bacterium]